MSFQNLQAFISALEKSGQLARVRAEVNPRLEITEIVQRTLAARGPALLFEKVKGSAFPVLINAFGSEERMNMALGVKDANEIADRIEALFKTPVPTTFLEKVKMLPMLAQLASYPPRIVTSAPCQEVRQDPVDLSKLPVLTCWPKDAGPFITLPLCFTRKPGAAVQNCGVYRLQVIDGKTAFFHVHVHHDAARHAREHAAAGHRRFPAAVAIGAPPEVTYAATAPLPPEIDEMLFAGFLREKHVDMAKCLTNDLFVPAESEFVLEGYVDLDDTGTEGPFGDHTGYYSMEGTYPKFHLDCVTHRKEPVYQSIVVGAPPQEDTFLGDATVKIFLPLLRLQMPEIVDISLPCFGVFHNFAFVSIKKQFPHHARKVMHGLWGLGQMSLEKFIVVVDADVDVHDADAVWFRVGANCDPKRDMEFAQGPTDILDHASPMEGWGTKCGIDATRKLPGEGFARPWPEDISMSEDVRARVAARWKEFGLNFKHDQ
jgi:4-hydroxy-3-polyprenylbenzoate decarboxylase